MLESWGIQCRVEPAQMADELNLDSIVVWMEVYRGETPWGYEQWKDLPVDNEKRFRARLTRVPGTLVYRSYYMVPESMMQPEETPNTVYQYMVRATFCKKDDPTEYPGALSQEDWRRPVWYRGSKVGAGNNPRDPKQFSAYTILDSISPRRAWVNELNLCDAMDVKGLHQFIELAVPQNADLKGWYVNFTDYNKQTATLMTFGIDQGVRDITSKTGENPGVDNTNHYTFVSVCAPSATGDVKNKSDGYWKSVTAANVNKGVFQYQYPYGIQLMRPSGIIEHEFVMQGTNVYAGLWGAPYEGTNLVAQLKAAEPDSQWFFAGEDLADADTSLGVWRSHGEEAIPSNWTNYMVCTPGELNRLKDGTLQDIPAGWFITPFGTNFWIYSTLSDGYVKQFYGGIDKGRSAVLVLSQDTVTNLVLSVTNWYQIGECTINGEDVTDALGKTGTYKLNIGPVTNKMEIRIGTKPQTALVETWGLTPENRYTPAVLDWLLKNYSGYGPEDLSAAQHRDFRFRNVEENGNPVSLSLKEMYWLNIPPVHKSPIFGGSNIWYVAGMGKPAWAGGPNYLPIDFYYEVLPDGTVLSNRFVTVTMMITNTVTHAAAPPDRLNGVEYDYEGEGSKYYDGKQAWTSVVFSITGALMKPDVSNKYLPLQQYVFTKDSFGAVGSDHPFQTRVMVRDPFASNSMGSYYGWSIYRFVYPDVFNKYTIEDNPDGRMSIVPLVPNWEPPIRPATP